ncbi:hypothetical protein H9L39_19013 [Fusarium oxysporum f. sp. albedinis]|nr:hypothetical protein H9L39_19013 [Fusarium oxysporum f. sp. albedinis]
MTPHQNKHAAKTAYEIMDLPQGKPGFVRIIHVGAGASGLLAAYKAKKMLHNYELVCYDKNGEVGGTWLKNRYPGCACDIPAHLYTYTFEPNPDWSGFYVYGPEIYDYFLKFYRKYELEEFVRLNTEVLSATWDEGNVIWKVKLRRDGEVFDDYCHVLINGSGVFSDPRLPSVPGLDQFQGTVMHSADWDPSFETRGKRVAVIGTGSSSIQMVAKIAQDAEHLTVFMRSSTWIAPQIFEDAQQVAEDGEPIAAVGKHYYTQREIEAFKKDPELFLAYRKDLETRMTRNFDVFLSGSEASQGAKALFKERMLARIGLGHEELKQHLIPDWSPGCRRMTPGEGYLEALTQPNVECVFDEISVATQTGLQTSNGNLYKFDVIACGTGFNVTFTPHFKIVGANGVIMQEELAEEPRLYCSITAPGYPNYFVVNGPRGNWGQGGVLPSLSFPRKESMARTNRRQTEVQLEYAFQCVQKMQKDGIKAMEVKRKPTDDFNDHTDLWHPKYSVWAEDCRSWYKMGTKDGKVHIWPGSILHLLQFLKTPRFEHYDIRYKNDNSFAFLGNGKTEAELDPDNHDLAPFIRTQDTPWEL